MSSQNSRNLARRRAWLALLALAPLAIGPHAATAQDNAAEDNPAQSAPAARPGLVGPDAVPAPSPSAPAAAPAGSSDEATSAPAQPAPARHFSSAELRQLLAPIALYPDPLLAQILSASAYPLQIVLAERWLERNKAAIAKGDFSGVDAETWDPAVKALAHFPAIIKRMSDDLDWTIDLGDAEVNQPLAVAEVIQQLRAEAKKAGTLRTTSEQIVTPIYEAGQTIIEVEPAEPTTIYVPTYDWGSAYGSAVPLIFSPGVAIVAWWRHGHCKWWNWRTGALDVWAGRPGQRPPYEGWRPGRPACANGACSNTELKAWRPGADYRPGLAGKARLPAAANASAGIGGPVRPFGAEGERGLGRSILGPTAERGPAATYTPPPRFAPRFPPLGRFEPPLSSHFGHLMPPAGQFEPQFGHLAPISPHTGQAVPPRMQFRPPMSSSSARFGPPAGLGQPGFVHPAPSPGLPLAPGALMGSH